MVSLLVIGGSGFVGRALCREGVRRGWQVTSLSRHGAPGTGINGVDWVQGSVGSQGKFKELAQGKDYIVSTVGTLVEGGPDESYERMNYESMRSILQAMHPAPAGLKAIGYLSAATFDPVTNSILSHYYATKHRAEADLRSWTVDTGKSGFSFRPGLVYGWDRPATVPASLIFRLLTFFTAGIFPPPAQVDRLAYSILSALETSADSSDAATFRILEPKDL